MKKLLVLVLVLGLASLASAATWSLDYDSGTGIITVSVVDAPQYNSYICLGVDADGVLSSFVKGTNAPVDAASATVMPDGYGFPFDNMGQGEAWAMNDFALEPAVPVYSDGVWLTASFAFVAAGPSTVTLYEYVEAESVINELTSIVIPEPATMALLCLGGLLIRKK